MSMWHSLSNDLLVMQGGQTFVYNKAFAEIVEDLEEDLSAVADKILTLEVLMFAQHLCATQILPIVKTNRKYVDKVINGLSQHEHAELFLKISGFTLQAYCQWAPGMTDEEYERMLAGTLTLRDLMEESPAVVFAPLLRGNLQFH